MEQCERQIYIAEPLYVCMNAWCACKIIEKQQVSKWTLIEFEKQHSYTTFIYLDNFPFFFFFFFRTIEHLSNNILQHICRYDFKDFIYSGFYLICARRISFVGTEASNERTALFLMISWWWRTWFFFVSLFLNLHFLSLLRSLICLMYQWEHLLVRSGRHRLQRSTFNYVKVDLVWI